MSFGGTSPSRGRSAARRCGSAGGPYDFSLRLLRRRQSLARGSGRKPMTKRVIDADGHICEPSRCGTLHRPAPSRRRRSGWSATATARTGSGSTARSEEPAAGRRLRALGHGRPEQRADLGRHPARLLRRRRARDGAGRRKASSAPLLFPSLYLLNGDIEDPDVAAAACHGATTNGSPTCAATAADASRPSAWCPLQERRGGDAGGRHDRPGSVSRASASGPSATRVWQLLRRVHSSRSGARSPATACSPRCMAASAR